MRKILSIMLMLSVMMSIVSCSGKKEVAEKEAEEYSQEKTLTSDSEQENTNDTVEEGAVLENTIGVDDESILEDSEECPFTVQGNVVGAGWTWEDVQTGVEMAAPNTNDFYRGVDIYASCDYEIGYKTVELDYTDSKPEDVVPELMEAFEQGDSLIEQNFRLEDISMSETVEYNGIEFYHAKGFLTGETDELNGSTTTYKQYMECYTFIYNGKGYCFCGYLLPLEDYDENVEDGDLDELSYNLDIIAKHIYFGEEDRLDAVEYVNDQEYQLDQSQYQFTRLGSKVDASIYAINLTDVAYVAPDFKREFNAAESFQAGKYYTLVVCFSEDEVTDSNPENALEDAFTGFYSNVQGSNIYTDIKIEDKQLSENITINGREYYHFAGTVSGKVFEEEREEQYMEGYVTVVDGRALLFAGVNNIMNKEASDSEMYEEEMSNNLQQMVESIADRSTYNVAE